MPFNFTNLGVPIWFLVKILFLFGIAVYLIFSAVVIKQVRIMAQTIEIPLAAALQALALTHFLFALAIFLLALLFL